MKKKVPMRIYLASRFANNATEVAASSYVPDFGWGWGLCLSTEGVKKSPLTASLPNHNQEEADTS